MGNRGTANGEYCIQKRSRESYEEVQYDIVLCKSRQRSTDRYCEKPIPIEENRKSGRG